MPEAMRRAGSPAQTSSVRRLALLSEALQILARAVCGQGLVWTYSSMYLARTRGTYVSPPIWVSYDFDPRMVP